MHFKTVSVLLALTVSALGLTTPHKYVSHEKRDAPLKKWAKRETMRSETVLPMRIGLKQPNIDNGHGENLLYEISHPDSPRYAQWYSPEEIVEIFAPPEDAVEAVKAWLHDAKIAPERISQSANKQWLQFDAQVHEAERLLKTKYHQYEHIATGRKHVACDEYHVPEHLQEHIDYVSPGLHLVSGVTGATHSRRPRHIDHEQLSDIVEKRGLKGSANPIGSIPVLGPVISKLLALLISKAPLENCDSYVTPQCIATMYNITKATKHAANNKLGIFEEGDFYAAEDLAEFFTLFAPNIPPTTEPILHGVDGGSAPGPVATGESDLDFQISYPIIYPQQSILFQTDDILYATGVEASSGFLNTFLDAIDGSYCTYAAYGEKGDSSIDPKYPDPNPAGYQGKLQCGVYKPTHVISISYGEQEDDLPTNYQRRQCNEFMKLGMQGTSVVIASGDSGVAARSTDDGNSDGCLGHGEVFNPDFPASCPYITAAGATFLPPGANVKKDQETAVTRFPSGGGFSNIYPRPSYQNSAVHTYLTDHTPTYKTYTTKYMNNPPANVTNGGLYNIAGRGYPDIGAIGDNVIIILDGTPMLIGGTSAAAPTFAAIINRINEERIAVGKKSIGFLNPTLYKNPSMFHDITVGNNSGCGTPGFYAAKGWDPVTGLGTPNYPAMLKVFMGLP